MRCKINKFAICFFLLILFFTSRLYSQSESTPVTLYQHSGMCDASAAVFIDSSRFIVANDEDNILRLYRNDQPGAPLKTFNLNKSLDITIDRKNLEADIEGATYLNNKIYWITSHGRNKEGMLRPNRYRLFATSIQGAGNNLNINQTGYLYKDLIQDLIQDKQFMSLKLRDASMLEIPRYKRLSPTENGINIEGLSATADGKSLLIAFRNPRPGNKALIIEIKNPDAVILAQAKPVFSPPILLDLGGLGIRSIEYSHALSSYIIIAGSHSGKAEYRIYKWSGSQNELPVLLEKETNLLKNIKPFNPEAIVLYPNSKSFQVLSDDGDIKMSGVKDSKKVDCSCKDLPDPKMKSFRNVWIGDI